MHLNANAMQVYYLDNPQVKEYLACALQRSREAIVQICPAIVDNLAEMLFNDDVSPQVKTQISLALLDRAGL